MKHSKVFQTNRKCFALMGIVQNECHNRYYPFSEKYLMITLMFVTGFISTWTFVFHVANSTKEYMNSFYALILGCSIFTSYTITILNVKKLFYFYDDCEKFQGM